MDVPRHHDDNTDDYQDGEGGGEVIDSKQSPDGRSLCFSLRMPSGSIRELAIPRHGLGVMLTSQGIVELPVDENN